MYHTSSLPESLCPAVTAMPLCCCRCAAARCAAAGMTSGARASCWRENRQRWSCRWAAATSAPRLKRKWWCAWQSRWLHLEHTPSPLVIGKGSGTIVVTHSLSSDDWSAGFMRRSVGLPVVLVVALLLVCLGCCVCISPQPCWAEV